jgi:predicted RNA-binding protein with PIN domain
VPYLIDGNNFIGHLSSESLKDPHSRHHLISRLLNFQKVKKTRIMLVFDGPPDPDLSDKAFNGIPFSVIYPPEDQNADSVIKEIISRQTDLRQFYVVSSDREIKYNARSQGAKSLSCQEFNRQLKEALKEYRKNAEMEKHVQTPTPLEIEYLTHIFKKKK